MRCLLAPRAWTRYWYPWTSVRSYSQPPVSELSQARGAFWAKSMTTLRVPASFAYIWLNVLEATAEWSGRHRWDKWQFLSVSSGPPRCLVLLFLPRLVSESGPLAGHFRTKKEGVFADPQTHLTYIGRTLDCLRTGVPRNVLRVWALYLANICKYTYSDFKTAFDVSPKRIMDPLDLSLFPWTMPYLCLLESLAS